MISGAAVLYPPKNSFEGWSLLTDKASIWKNIHPTLVWVYYICIIMALWGTLQALPEIYACVIQEFFQAVWLERKFGYDTIRRWICLYIFLTTMVIIWLNIPFDILTQIVGFILANFSIALMMLAVLYLNFKLPTAYRTRPFMLVGSLIPSVVLIVFAGSSAWGLFIKFFAGN